MRLIFLSLVYLLLTACMSMANVDYDRSVNFKSFSTYNIKLEPVQIDKDTRVTTPFMQERIVKAIESELTKKGLSNKDKKADLKIKYHVGVKKDFETEGSSLSIGFGSTSHHSAIGMGFVFPVGETYSIDKLVLTIDVVSAKTNKLVWRGSLAYPLNAGSTPETYTRMANDLVAEILEDYPPK